MSRVPAYPAPAETFLSRRPGVIPVVCTSPGVVSKFFRLKLSCSNLRGLDAGIEVIRPKSGWIVNVAGPAKEYSWEKVVFEMKQGI